MRDYLEFEKPLREVEEKIEKLAASGGELDAQLFHFFGLFLAHRTPEDVGLAE